ncbi:MAG: Ig-like domain-containing protein, partial [Peptococcaceae bacterium]|nr:Ig-like domain-containing protein [Peptococcaceae bacterium]
SDLFFTATDNTVEDVTFTIRMTSPSTAQTSVGTQWEGANTATATSTAQSGNYYLDLAVSSNSAVTGQPVVFTVTVGNDTGTPVGGTGVSITSSSANAVPGATSLTTNAQGQAFFTATDNTAETVTFTATPTGGGSAQSAGVTWTTPSTPVYSSYTAVPSLAITATAATAAVGQPVVYEVTASTGYVLPPDTMLTIIGSSASVQLSSPVLTTNSAGQAFFTATDNTAETVMFTVRLSSNPQVMATSTTQWLNSYTQPNNLSNNAPIYLLSMEPSPASPAVGQPVVLDLAVLDSNGHLTPGIGVSLISSSSTAQLSSTYVTTNSQGQAYVTVTDPVAETVTITGSLANVTSRRPYYTTTIQWSSQTGGSSGYTGSQVTVSGYYVSLSESAVSLSTGQPAVLTVTVTNSDNQRVGGVNVLLTSSSPNVQLTGTNTATNSQGQVYVTAVDNTAENVTFSVQLETNGTYSTPVVVGTFQWY